MLFQFILILILPIMCQSKIKIKISVALKKNDVVIEHMGEDNKVLTEHEQNLFNITKVNLNRGMRVELGKAPNGIFLKDPTPYGDLFKKFNWPEAERNVRVEKVEVMEVINELVLLNTHEHINNSSDVVRARRSLFENVETSVHSAWSKHGLPDEDIFYDIAVNFGDNIFVYENKWRNRSIRNHLQKVGVRKKGFITIKPGQTALTKLMAFKTVLTVEIEYKAQIVGNLIGDYENLYGKYHFWSPTMWNIMKAAKIKNDIKTTESVEVVCYTDPRLDVFDMDTGVPIKSDGPKRQFGKLKHKKMLPIHN